MRAPATAPSSTVSSPGTESEVRILRRIAWLAVAYALVGAAAYGLWRGPAGALVLTLSALASIVNFRGLEAFAVLLEPQRQGTLGARNTLLITLRLVILVGVISAALALGAKYLLAVILGFSVLPGALITEAVIESTGLDRNGNRHGG